MIALILSLNMTQYDSFRAFHLTVIARKAREIILEKNVRNFSNTTYEANISILREVTFFKNVFAL